MKEEKNMRKLAEDMIQAVSDLSNYLREKKDLMKKKDLMTGAEEDQERIRQSIREALHVLLEVGLEVEERVRGIRLRDPALPEWITEILDSFSA